MTGIEAFRYDGKHVLVVGGATGMGAAAAKTVGALGARVTVLDYAPVDYDVAKVVQVDVRDRDALDTALAEVAGPVQAVVSAAGVADGTPGLMKINFIAHRHIIETLVGDGRLGPGGAVCMISSVAGIGWEANMSKVLEFLDTPDYESAVAWVEANEGSDGYVFSKQAINCYAARQGLAFVTKGIRINAICPGPTDTPLARANDWLMRRTYTEATGTDNLTADQMGNVMVFLNSDAASGINGVNILVDAGWVMSSVTGSWDDPTIKMLLGR